ncbi:MAG TPA: mannose-1-phosphate guanyltransferase, partial [Actinobacteria bacterium]|nr:mannose-1-phosphate guanyltransferase [Actinomycetota bacterium]
MTLHPVILAGGIGSRLWPLSRRDYPKQLTSLLGDYTMLQSTALRAIAIHGAARPIVVCGAQHAEEIFQQLARIDCVPGQMVIEPVARNTAPAIAAAAMTVDPDDLLLI